MVVNRNAIIVSLVLALVGVCLLFGSGAPSWIGVGGSLLASALVVFLDAVLISRVKIDPLEPWGIEKIYNTRTEKNNDSDPHLDKAQFRVDGVAFGLRAFRSTNLGRVEGCLQRGVNFRLLVMHPDSIFAAQRDAEEGSKSGHIAASIHNLLEWARGLNSRGYKGKIEIKGYKCMTLDFYWRVDDEIYFGPYWLDEPSHMSITYKLKPSGKAFSRYSNYFERLWSRKDMEQLV